MHLHDPPKFIITAHSMCTTFAAGVASAIG